MKATVIQGPVAVNLELTLDELVSLRTVINRWCAPSEVDRHHIAEARRILAEAAERVQRAKDAT